MVFDLIRASILLLPLAIFVTFTLIVVVNSTLRVRKADVHVRCVAGLYCGASAVSSFVLLAYYYIPSLFALLDIGYMLSVMLSQVIFYHFFHYAIQAPFRFARLHYLVPLLLFVLAALVKLLFPPFWLQQGMQLSLIVALIVGVGYSLLTLAHMQHYMVAFKFTQGGTHTLRNWQITLYALESLLFPAVFSLWPLVGGQTPNMAVSVLIMLSILLALWSNIPLTYAMIRHYTSLNERNTSLFEAMMPLKQRVVSPPSIEDNYSESVSSVQHPGSITPQPGSAPGAFPPGFDTKMFARYINRQKPYRNPHLTIADVAKALDTNRTYVSTFVNKAYKMSFSNYINFCRLREMNRLMAHPSNKGLTPANLLAKTGFGTLRNYYRARHYFATNATHDKSKTQK